MTFHPKNVIQVKSTIHTLEDMLWVCEIDFKGNYEDHLPLIEFSYNNNSYIGSISGSLLQEVKVSYWLVWRFWGQFDRVWVGAWGYGEGSTYKIEAINNSKLKKFLCGC